MLWIDRLKTWGQVESRIANTFATLVQGVVEQFFLLINDSVSPDGDGTEKQSTEHFTLGMCP